MSNFFCERKKVKTDTVPDDATTAILDIARRKFDLPKESAKSNELGKLDYYMPKSIRPGLAIPTITPLIAEKKDHPKLDKFLAPHSKSSNFDKMVIPKEAAKTEAFKILAIKTVAPKAPEKATGKDSTKASNSVIPPKPKRSDFDIQKEQISTTDFITLNLMRESSQAKKLKDLMNDREKRLHLLETTYADQADPNDPSGLLGVNLLEEGAEIRQTEPAADFYIESILTNPFKLSISKDNFHEKILPAEFTTIREYKKRLLDVFVDEIRANLLSTRTSEEFKKMPKITLECNFLYQEDQNNALLQFSIPKDTKIDAAIEQLQMEFDKSAPMILISLKHLKKEKSMDFVGIKVNKRKDNGPGNFVKLDRGTLDTMWVFKFSKRIFRYFNKSLPNQSIACRFFTNFISQKRELKSILKISEGSTNIVNKTLRIHHHKNYLFHTGDRHHSHGEGHGGVLVKRNHLNFGNSTDNPLLNEIGHRHNLPTSINKTVPYKFNPSLNESQKEAITHALSTENPITLIQGPPGTGKSHTVVELVKMILENESTNDQKKKILICTPSNTALDELLLRFANSFKLFNFLSSHISRSEPLDAGSVLPQASTDGPKKSPTKPKSNKNPKVIDMVDKSHSASKSHFEHHIKVLRIGKLSEDAAPAILPFNSENIAKLSCRSSNKAESQKQIQNDFNQLSDLLRKRADNFHPLPELDRKIASLEHEIEMKQNISKRGYKQIEKILVESSKIIFSTLNSAAKKVLKPLKDNISVLIIDEASQATEIQNLIPLKLRPQRMILIGDPCQLPATTFHPLSKDLRLERSMFERLMNNGHPVSMLKVQYRMSPQIASFPSYKFYQGLLRNGPKVCAPDYSTNDMLKFIRTHINNNHVAFFNLIGQTQRKSNSYYNMDEIEFIIKILQVLVANGIRDIGIISPYKQQCNAFRRELFENEIRNIEVNTVDGFQGREKDVIVLSCVKSIEDRSKKASSIGFLDDPRRLNVSITRARHLLIVVGNQQTLSANSLWESYLDFLGNEKLILQAKDFQANKKPANSTADGPKSKLNKMIQKESKIASQIKNDYLYPELSMEPLPEHHLNSMQKTQQNENSNERQTGQNQIPLNFKALFNFGKTSDPTQGDEDKKKQKQTHIDLDYDASDLLL